jgi:DNA (cytosine-5)-methyltransferase 1
VFVVAHARDWRRAAAVLFERESVFGNPPTRGATGQGITSSPQGIAGNVSSKWAKGTGGPAGDECYNLVAEPFTKSKRAQSTTDDESWVPGEVSPTMSCFDQGDTRAKTVVAQGFTYSGYSNQPAWMTGDRTDCLPASGHSDGSHEGVGVAIGFDGFQSGNPKATHQATEEGTGPLIRNRPHCVATPMAVRRLTPRECERLQGFPDDYTLVTYRNKPAADGPRYRALGNSMAVPVMRWIGERVAQVDSMDLKGGAA